MAFKITASVQFARSELFAFMRNALTALYAGQELAPAVQEGLTLRDKLAKALSPPSAKGMDVATRTTPDTSLRFVGLPLGPTYTFAVRAQNAVGASAELVGGMSWLAERAPSAATAKVRS